MSEIEILVTSYIHPDLDGTASAVVYAEILRAKGQKAESVLFGKPQPSVHYAARRLKYHLPFEESDQKSRWKSFVIVDTSISKRLPKFIEFERVVEIIDHHPAEDGKDFPLAKIQNEEVGAVATLVCERAAKEKVELNESLSKLIYLAIFDNTVFLLANVNKKDLVVMDKLKKKYGFDNKLTEGLIEYDQKYKTDHFDEVFLNDLKEIDTNEGKCVVGQMVFPDDKSKQTGKHVESLAQKLVRKRKARVLMSLIDPYTKDTKVYTSDRTLQDKISRAYEVSFTNNWALVESVVLRKKMLIAIKK